MVARPDGSSGKGRAKFGRWRTSRKVSTAITRRAKSSVRSLSRKSARYRFALTATCRTPRTSNARFSRRIEPARGSPASWSKSNNPRDRTRTRSTPPTVSAWTSVSSRTFTRATTFPSSTTNTPANNGRSIVVRGSENWEKQRRKVAKAKRRIRWKVLDFQHKLSAWLVWEYDVVAVEDLDVKPMLETSHSAKNKQDVA